MIFSVSLNGQNFGYSPTDDLYSYLKSEYESINLKGNINYIRQFSLSNSNYHSSSDEIILENSTSNEHEFLLTKNGEIQESIVRHKSRKISVKRVYTNNKISWLEKFSKIGELEYKRVYEYNELNLLVKETELNKNDSIIYTKSYLYNKKNQLTDVIKTDYYKIKYLYIKDNEFYEVRYSDYKDNLSIHEARYFLNDGENKIYINSMLKSKGIKTFDEIYNAETILYYEKEYNSGNKLIRDFHKGRDGNTIEIIHEYNNTIITRSIRVDSENEFKEITEYEYFENKLVSRIAKDDDNRTTFKEILKYNEYADLSYKEQKREFFKEIYTYEYSYDLKGNWIERKEYINDKLFEVVKREIEYRN